MACASSFESGQQIRRRNAAQANFFHESGLVDGVSLVKSRRKERQYCHINLSPRLPRGAVFRLLSQMVNLLPKLERPVTRQEKMATVWDEAEVRAGEAGGSGARATGRPRWREGRRWLRGSRSSPVPGLGPLGMRSRLRSGFFFFADSGLIEAKSWLTHSAELTALNLRKKNYFFHSKMESGRKFSRCPQKRSSSAHGCWTVKSRWAVKPLSLPASPRTRQALVLSRRPQPPSESVGTAVSSSDQKKRKLSFKREGERAGVGEQA